MNIRAIPTTYNGISFRSRCEARWAVFMDAIKCPYIYEPEGYDLGKAGWYLPDFWLPSMSMFMEVKPDAYINHERTSPTEELCAHTQLSVITFHGSPWAHRDPGGESGYFYTWLCDDEGRNSCVAADNCYYFCVCPVCKRPGIQFFGRADRVDCECPKSDHGGKGYNYDDPVLLHAFQVSANAFK